MIHNYLKFLKIFENLKREMYAIAELKRTYEKYLRIIIEKAN